MAQRYYYDFHGKFSNDPNLTPEEQDRMDEVVQILDPLAGNKPVEGVIAYNDHSGVLEKYQMFKGEPLKDHTGSKIVLTDRRVPPMPEFKVVINHLASTAPATAPAVSAAEVEPEPVHE